MSTKPHIVKSSKTFVNQKSDNFVVGSQQKTQEPDLFYEIEAAEVLYVINKVSDLETFQLVDDEGQPDKSILNSCVVRKIYTEPNRPILNERGSNLRQFIAKPLDSNLLKLPIKGEILPIIYFISSDSTTNVNLKTSYYMSGVNIWNSPHHNSIPNISALDALAETTSEDVKKPEDGNPFVEGEELPDLGEFFTERDDVKKVQVYEGDIILEGRFGQHIRLGSSDKILDENSNWWSEGSDETLGRPVTIISNGQSQENVGELEPRDLYKTDVNKDPSTIILTENQPTSIDLAYLDLGSDDAILNTLQFDSILDTQNPTIQMNSGTIMLNARDNKLLGFAKSGIGLVTTGDMSIDVTNTIESTCDVKIEEMSSYYTLTTQKMDAEAKKSNLGEKAVAGSGEPMVLGNKLVDVLTTLIDAIPLYVFVGGGGTHMNQPANPGENIHKTLKGRLKDILSDNHTLD